MVGTLQRYNIQRGDYPLVGLEECLVSDLVNNEMFFFFCLCFLCGSELEYKGKTVFLQVHGHIGPNQTFAEVRQC